MTIEHSIDGDRITGEVNNQLVNQPLKVGELITVGFENIYKVFDEFILVN